MSKLSNCVKEVSLKGSVKEVNYMNGISYKSLNPLATLKLITASAIFAEPSYYEKSGFTNQTVYDNTDLVIDYSKGSRIEIFTKAIDEALKSDFKGTLEWAKELRNDYYMRLNPNIIFIRAALSENRVKFNELHPNFMKEIGNSIILIPEDMQNQFEYYMYLNGSKSKLPAIVKRTWTKALVNLDRYQVNKYKKDLIDLTRIADTKKVRSKNKYIDELMQFGSITIEDNKKTWEQLRSSGKSFKEIFNTINFPHMALLRNLRNIFEEDLTFEEAKKVCEKLKSGVLNGKQFPFRYYTAYNVVNQLPFKHKSLVLDTLEECMDIAMSNFPKLSGTTVCLSDNSGSAWSGFTSEYGSVTVANIANLSSIMTAINSDIGIVVGFGDDIDIKQVSKRNGCLKQLLEFEKKFKTVGRSTEHGIWKYLQKAIDEKIHIDNLFIYSDQQAGHGGLYGYENKMSSKYPYKGKDKNYIDVLKMVEMYRKCVNKNVNVFSVQVAGYKNTVMPENYYRTAILTGWTGKEVLYAKALNDIWNK